MIHLLNHFQKNRLPFGNCLHSKNVGNTLSNPGMWRQDPPILRCDACNDAIAPVAYMKTFNEGSSDVVFLFGKAKLAPSHGHSIPRSEFCAALVAVELAEIAKAELSLKKEDFHFYSDSRVVFGYIAAETRRFHVYVSNRVDRIRTF